MSSDARWVNDPDQLDQIIQKVFCKVQVILRHADQNMPVQVERLGPGQIALSHTASDAAARVIVARLQEGLIVLECVPDRRLPDGRELCKPRRLQVHRALRKEPRTEIGPAKIFASSVVPSRQFPEAMAAGDVKRDNYLAAVEKDLRASLGEVSIILRKTIRLDFRMKALQAGCRSILFSPEIISPDERFVPVKDYQQIITYDKLPKGVVSEISVGIYYRKNYMYGFIRAFSPNSFSLAEFDHVSSVARKIEKFFEESNLLPSNPDKCPILDLSMSGAGLLHPQSPIVMQKFMPGESVLLDISFPEGSLNFSASIRNIRSLENAHRIGIEFEGLDSIRTAALEKALGPAVAASQAPGPSPGE